jgi:putative redox protein
MHERAVTVVETGNGPYAQFVTAGRHVFGADEPEGLGGKDTGPDPYELLLAGLGACTAMTIRMYAARKNMLLARVEVRLRHLQRATAGKDIGDIFERVITLKGNLTPEQRQSLLEIAERLARPCGRVCRFRRVWRHRRMQVRRPEYRRDRRQYWLS